METMKKPSCQRGKVRREGTAPSQQDCLNRLKESVSRACDAFFIRRKMGKARWNW